MITGLNHSGLVVEDLERSIHFYRDVIGLELVRTMDRDGGPISEVAWIRKHPSQRRDAESE